jgi:hypothetical protein
MFKSTRTGKNIDTIVCLESDVEAMFPSADFVNETLQFLVAITGETQAFAPKKPNNSLGTDS